MYRHDTPLINFLEYTVLRMFRNSEKVEVRREPI